MTDAEIEAEIKALMRLASQYPDDVLVQASIAGQINLLEWIMSNPRPCDLPSR